MKARILVKTFMPASLALLLILLIISPPLGAQTPATGTYVYTLGTDGTADVNIIVSNVTGQSTIYVRVDPGIVPESLIAIDEKGNIIPTSIVGMTVVQAIPANQSTQLYVRYEAIVGEASGGLVKDVISPGGPATIRLPKGAALLYFNGTPSSIKMIGNQIVIEYSNPGTYEIEFTLPAPPTSQTTSTTSTTTTTTTTPTTSSTTTIRTPTSTTSTSTTATGAASPFSTSTTIITTSTTSTTTQTSSRPTTPNTITSPTLTSGTTTSTSATSTQQTTQSSSSTPTKPQPSQSNTAWVYASIAIVIIATIISVATLRARRAKHSSATTSMGELIRAEELDERDYEILKALKESTETISSLARKLGLSKSVVWRRVQKLLRLGLISKEDKGGRTYLSITEEGLKRLGEEA